MERLTKPLCGGYELPMIPMEIKTQDDLQKFHEVRKFYEACAIRCGQYEDTGLEPEEIKNALDVNDIIPEINATVDHICDLLKAEQDGRMVVLPFEPHSSMMNLSDPKNPGLMNDVRLSVSWTTSGIVFNAPYDFFLQDMKRGYIKPVSKGTEAALAGKGGAK